MAFTAADIDEFIALIEKDPALRERVRTALIDDSFARLAATFAQSQEDERKFREEMRQFETDMRTFESEMHSFQTETLERFDGVDRRLDGIDQRLDGVDQRLDGVDKRLNNVEGRLGNLEGGQFEAKVRDHLPGRLGPRYHAVRKADVFGLKAFADAAKSGKVTREQARDLGRADAVASARDADNGGREIMLVIEVSRVVDQSDVRRARRRADILRLAGIEAVAVVVGEVITQAAVTEADSASVMTMIDKQEPVEVEV